MGRPAGSKDSAAVWLTAVVAAWLALYFRQLFLGKTFILRDQLVYTWTERHVLADALRAGRFAEWNDLIGFGAPFAASGSNGVTYPLLWLCALLPLPLSMDLVAALHVLLSGVGTALFARRLGARVAGAALAGIAFMSCGYVASIAPNKIFTGTAWLPLVAWAADRLALAQPGRTHRLRAALVLAALLGAQFLAGDPASSITSGLVAVIVVAARSDRRLATMGWLCGAASAALVLAAASVLPGFALLPWTSRASLSFADATTWSLHPLRLLELVWPFALGNPLDAGTNLAELLANTGGGELAPSWSLSLFLGAPVLALAVTARPQGGRLLLAGCAVLCLLALGACTPLYGLYRAAFIPESIIRYPEKHIAGALCIACALAGAGLAQAAAARKALIASVACLASALGAAVICRPWLLQRLAGAAALLSPPLDVRAALAYALRSGAIALAVAALASWLLLHTRHPRFGRSAAAAAVAVLFAHLLWTGWQITPVGPARQFAQLPALLRTPAAAASEPSPPRRILRSPVVEEDLAPDAQASFWHETLYLDGPGRFGFASVPGFEGFRSKAYAALCSKVGEMPLDAFLTLFAVDYVALPSEVRRRLLPDGGRPQGTVAELEYAPVSDAGEGEAWSLAKTSGTRPRAFVAPRWSWTPQEQAALALVAPSRASDPARIVLTGKGDPGDGAGPLEPCRFTAYEPERIVLACDAPRGGYAVLADEMAPGWTAAVDGQEAQLETADLLLRAVRIGPGPHRIELRYRTPLLRLGALFSALAWLGWLALWHGLAARSARRSVVQAAGLAVSFVDCKPAATSGRMPRRT
jgi:hypothetical protein